MTEPRADLVRGLLQCCYVIEASRANVLKTWGDDFAEDAVAVASRATRLDELLRQRGIATVDDVVEPHTKWFEALCGSTPTEVPLGPAFLLRLATWSDVYAAPYLGEEAESFKRLGEAELRFPVEPRDIEREEAFIPVHDVPPGRRFAILTDIHTGAKWTDETTAAAIADVNAIAPEFVVMPGDLTDDGEPVQFARAKQLFDTLDVPYHAVLGNHDAVQRSTRDENGHDRFTETFGYKPTDKILEVGNLQIALVDSTDPTPSPFPDWDIQRGRYNKSPAGVDSGAFRPGQVEALADRLDANRPTLLVMHHEQHPFPGFPPVKFAVREEDSWALFEALRGHNIVGLVAGHTHRSAILKIWDGSVTQVELPSLKDWPYCYTVVGVEDDKVHITVRQISDAELVWSRSHRIPPIYQNFVLGPWANLNLTLPVNA